MVQQIVTFESDTLHVKPWPDDVVEKVGFDPRSPYVERFWLSIIGPSATWLMRRVAAGFDASPEGFDLPLSDTARALGLGDRGRHSPLLRTVSRLILFELAHASGPSELTVRRKLAPLSRRHTHRLPPALQEAHARWQNEQLEEPPGEALRRRGRQLALSLLELGEDSESAERQLLRWRYHPALAREAVVWACERHKVALAAATSAGTF